MSVIPPNFKNSSLSPVSSRNLLQPGQDGSQENPKSNSQSSSSTRSNGIFDFPDDDNKHVNDPNKEWVVLNKYLQDKELLQVVNSWMLLIASLDELPYNPYPTLVWYARRQSESCFFSKADNLITNYKEMFYLFFEEEEDILQKLDYSVYNVGDHVVRTQEEPARWGLRPLLKAVDTKTLEKFDWLLATIPLDTSHLDTIDANYAVHDTVPVLTGPCIFLGSLYPDVPLVTVQLEYGIAGPRKEYALEMFAELVLNDIKRFEEQDMHILLGVLVPEQDDQSWSYSTWTYQSLRENKEEFLFMVQAATRNQRNIISQCLFRLDPNIQHYKRGEIAYSLNFMRVESDRVVSESPLPYLGAYQGVFKSHSSFINYLAWFENVEKPEKPPEFREPTTSTTKRSSIFFTRSKKTSNRNPLPSIASTTATSNTALRGTGTTNSSVYLEGGPYSDHVRETMREHLQQKIASLPGHENLFAVLHKVILLLLFDRDQEQAEDGLIEAYRLLQSTLYKLYLVIEENSLLQSLVSQFAKQESPDSYLMQMLYLEYRQHLKDILCNELQERSNEFTIAGQVLLDRLDAITVRPSLRVSSKEEEEPGTLPLNTEVFNELQVINRYCLTLMLGLVDDALVFCPTLKQYFPPIDTSGHSLLTNYTFKHGVEKQSILHQDKTYLNIHDAEEKIRAPALITPQAVILKYFVETRLDQTFEGFLGQLLSSSCLPPNPYPRLVSHLGIAAVSMEMFGEKRERLVSRLLPGSAQLVDAKHFLYGFPGSEAYGVISSLCALDSKHYNDLLIKTRVIHNEVSTRVTDQGIKATVGVALTGFSPLYGRFMPYFHEVELEEHYLLQGPSHIKTETINHFTKLVYDHLAGFAEESSVLFVGLFLGDVRRSLSDIVQKKSSFIPQFSSAVKQKKQVYLKAYIQLDWRLVLVKKSFLLHYIEGQFIGYHRFYTQSPIAYYQNVFSSQATASLFVRACGPQDSSNPCKGANLRMSLVHVNHHIESAKQDGDLLSAYRWLLVRALICQTSSYVAEAWYMLHSAAAQLEYLITLNKTLQNLIYEELSRTFAPTREDAENNQSLLDVAVLGRMTMAYSQKLYEVLKRGTCMAPSGLKDLLQNKLRLVTDVNQTSNTLQLKISQQSVSVLQEINDYLQPLLDASAYEIHQICPEVQHVLSSVTTEIQLSQ